jgi:hypothetical protein
MIRKYPTESDRAQSLPRAMRWRTHLRNACSSDILEQEHKSDACAKAWNVLSDEQQVSFVLARQADKTFCPGVADQGLTQGAAPWATSARMREVTSE